MNSGGRKYKFFRPILRSGERLRQIDSSAKFETPLIRCSTANLLRYISFEGRRNYTQRDWTSNSGEFCRGFYVDYQIVIFGGRGPIEHKMVGWKRCFRTTEWLSNEPWVLEVIRANGENTLTGYTQETPLRLMVQESYTNNLKDSIWPTVAIGHQDLLISGIYRPPVRIRQSSYH